MIESTSQAVDEMFTMLKDAWETNSETALIPIMWGNVAHDYQGQPDIFGNQLPFLHVQALHTPSRQVSLGGSMGSRFEHTGSLVASLRYPEGKGTVLAHDLISVAGDAFMGKRSPGGVWFRNPGYSDIGTDRTWYVITMTTTFVYDLIR